MDARSVRLDVYVNDGKGTVYDIEMQAVVKKELPRRSRYYQCMIDLQLLDKGESYTKLNHSFVIFICLSDMFGKGRHIYTFLNTCKEEPGLLLEDGAAKIFLNADGIADDVSPELKAFLDYVAGKKSEDTFVQKLDEALKEAKKNRKWRHEYMTLLMRDQENREQGREEGREEGRAEGRKEGISHGEEMMAELINRLSADKRSAEILKVTTDKAYRQKLYEEYNIV